MIFILLYFASTSALFTVFNSNTSKTSILTSKYLTIGNPGLYTFYGKAIFMSNYTTYTALPNLTASFGVFWNYQTYSLAKLSLLAQNSGAVGAIFVSQNNNWKFSSVPNDQNDVNMVKILVIGMSQQDANYLKGYPNRIWMMYQYDMKSSQTPKINLYISGNYTEDKAFTKELQQLNGIIPLQKANFRVYLDVPNSSDNSLNRNTDCIRYRNNDYLCMRSSSSVKGNDKVNNSVMILKYFDSITDPTVFFASLMDLYNNCEFDYSQSCILARLIGISSASTSDLYNYRIYYIYGYEYTCYTVNDIEINSPSFLQSSYCLSFNSAPAACTPCSASCSYSSIQNSICDIGCNVSSCAYDNLNCIKSGSCYNFLLGDGQCDSVCSNDPDCNSNNICTSGCLYSDMKSGLCPVACTGSCFSNCSSAYCSPGCLYQDLFSGICSSSCTSACLKNCLVNNTCTAGCLYSDMKNGLCPLACSGTCFSNCSSAFCSPGCLYKDLSIGVCSSNCTSNCLKNCVTNNTCALGCSYSDMKNGLCPLACSGTCFSFCNNKYCSPNCLYSDLNAGICSSNCTPDCLAKCVNNTDKCNSGCLYSDMAKGLCPASCSGDCFKHCNSSIYCSADCLYSDLSFGLCSSSSCTNDCVSRCNISNICSTGCYFSDMLELRECSNLCTGSCFRSCDSSIYCSPGCAFNDLKLGQCSTDCSDSCLSNCNIDCSDSCHKDYVENGECPDECDIICCRIEKSRRNSKITVGTIVMISVVLGIVLLVALCIVCCVRVLIRRNNLRRSGNNSGSIVISEHELKPKNGIGKNNELRPTKFYNDMGFVGDAVCTIDLSGFSVGDDVILTPCLHLFHPMCIKEWLETVGREKKCPNCNFALDGVLVSLN